MRSAIVIEESLSRHADEADIEHACAVAVGRGAVEDPRTGHVIAVQRHVAHRCAPTKNADKRVRGADFLQLRALTTAAQL
ncbi:hypothetical protein D3C72_1800090 [compost metagenome]